MRILSVHNRYQIRGGEDESCESEERLLQERGHQVDVYTESNDRVGELGMARVAARTVWSVESYKIVQQRLAQQPYDILHVQNFFPLISPSVYYAAKAAGIPVVQTLRNYRLACPNGLFFRDGVVCEDCLGKAIPWPGVMHSCYRQSWSASLGVSTMLTVHRGLATWRQMVDIYITLTEFARQKLIAGGLPADKIVVKPNFMRTDPGVGTGKGGFVLYAGRLSTEKGLDTLLAAWQKLGSKVPLKIIGTGPLETLVAATAYQSPYIEWLGCISNAEVLQLMGEALVLVFPSKWYETFGRVAMESFAKGTPVIAARIGAIAELVDHGRTGLLFNPGDPDDLAAQVEYVLAHPQILAQMRQAARFEYESKYSAEINYNKLREIYDRVRIP